MSEVWRCDVTGNPVGTDTRMIGAGPCLCQGCRASARVDALEKERDAAVEAEDEAKDCFWAIYPTYCKIEGHGISTEAARTKLAVRAEVSQARLSEAVKVLKSVMPYADDLSYDTSGSYHSDIRAAKAFLATLGEENEA